MSNGTPDPEPIPVPLPPPNPIRDAFAQAALAGALAFHGAFAYQPSAIAEKCGDIADAFMREREPKPTPDSP